MKVLAPLLAVLILSPPLAFAQNVEKKTPPDRPGTTTPRDRGTLKTDRAVGGSVYIGEFAPDFELDSSEGGKLKISSLRGNWVLLIFAGRKEHLTPLGGIVEDMREISVRMVGVCDEKEYHLRGLAEKGGTTFPLLADVTGEISALYGLHDSLRRTTQPGFFLIDPEGKVQMALLGQRVPGKDLASLARFAVTGL